MTDLSWHAAAIRDEAVMAAMAWQQAAWEAKRPSVLYRPALSADGDQWCALFGENLQEGVSGFGETPEQAMAAFDVAWAEQKTPCAALMASRKDGSSPQQSTGETA